MEFVRVKKCRSERKGKCLSEWFSLSRVISRGTLNDDSLLCCSIRRHLKNLAAGNVEGKEKDKNMQRLNLNDIKHNVAQEAIA